MDPRPGDQSNEVAATWQSALLETVRIKHVLLLLNGWEKPFSLDVWPS
jgi:hypothetical protein